MTMNRIEGLVNAVMEAQARDIDKIVNECLPEWGRKSRSLIVKKIAAWWRRSR